jgi:multiple sugar transport system ATP-binding protein
VLAAAAQEGSDTVFIGFRPEALELVGADEAALNVSVTMVEELGSEAYAYGTLPGETGTGSDIIARVDPRTPPAKGQQIALRIRPGGEYFFSAKTGERLTTR